MLKSQYRLVVEPDCAKKKGALGLRAPAIKLTLGSGVSIAAKCRGEREIRSGGEVKCV
jgi:hypothetical protein